MRLLLVSLDKLWTCFYSMTSIVPANCGTHCQEKAVTGVGVDVDAGVVCGHPMLHIIHVARFAKQREQQGFRMIVR
jgi:hypothetical protein